MGKHRVIGREISVGQPLPWDVYDEAGTLLLRRGFVIDTQRSLDRLVAQGMFLSENAGGGGGKSSESKVPAGGRASAVHHLRDARRLLAASNQRLEDIPDFAGRTHKTAQHVDSACDARSEESIGSILLLQREQNYAVRHPINTAVIANLIARSMSLPRDKVMKITGAALTMNISKFEVQDRLHGFMGELNSKLRRLIHAHPQQSIDRLRKLGIRDPYWLACIEQHHENPDGSGYPNQLSGNAIELGARIVGIADRYCARLSIRNYRPPQRPDAILKDLFFEKGEKVDEKVAGHLFRVVGLYPPGTIVRLRNSEIAVVTSPGETVHTPVAHAVIGASGVPLAVPVPRNTARADFEIQGVMTVDKVNFRLNMSSLWNQGFKP